MMATATNAGLLDEEPLQSYFKHALLKRYAPQFAHKLKGHAPVLIVDSYAGRGRYDDGSPGSSDLILRIARADERLGVTLIERNPKFAAELRALAAEHERQAHGRAGWAEVVNGDAIEGLSRATTAAPESHHLLYIDPCGYGAPFGLLVRLLTQRNGWPRTEIMLNFNSMLVNRVGAEALKSGRVNDKLSLACGGEWWKPIAREKVQEAGNWSTAIPSILREFVKRLRKATGQVVFAVPIRSEPEKAPVFFMVCTTGSPKGLWAYSDSVARARDDWAKEAAGRQNVDVLVPVEASKRDIPGNKAIVRENMLRLVAMGCVESLEEKSGEVLRGALGQLTDAEVGQVARTLEKERLVAVEKPTSGGNPGRYRLRQPAP